VAELMTKQNEQGRIRAMIPAERVGAVAVLQGYKRMTWIERERERPVAELKCRSDGSEEVPLKSLRWRRK